MEPVNIPGYPSKLLGANRTVRRTLRFDKSGTFYIAATHEWNRHADGGTLELSLMSKVSLSREMSVDVGLTC